MDNIFVPGMIESLFLTHARALGAFFRRRLGKAVDTDDLIQEVYVRMLSAKVDGIRNVEAYLFTVAANLAKERGRAQSRSRAQRDIEDPDVQEQVAATPNFEGQLDADARMRRLRAVLLSLSPKCQAVVALHYRDGMNYQQIAAHLEISSDMVKKYVVTALALCRRMLTGVE